MLKYQKEIIKLIKLSTPVLIASVAQTGMGFVDTVMAGSVSATDMAAVAIAASVWLPSVLFGVGLLMALVPVVAQLNGSGKSQKVPFEIHQGIYLALLTSLPIMTILYNAGFIIAAMDVEPLLFEKTQGYLHAVMWAVPAFLLFQALRSFCEGLSLTIPAMIIGFIGLAANIPLNWMFVYGELGAPSLGGVGCGVATAIVYWLMFISMVIYTLVAPKLRRVNLYQAWSKPQKKEIYRLFKLGLPVALSIFFEVTLFAAVALLVSPLGSTVVAAHQVAINFSSLIFMVPMSIAVGVSIRVGRKVGEKDLDGAKVASYSGLAFGLFMACITAILTVIFRQDITYLYSDNQAVVELAMSLMLFAAIYQCTDSIQVVASGALRGYKDMNAIFKCTFVSYWIIGLPSGYILAMTDWIIEPIGVYGFWIGFIGGLSTAAILLGLRLRWLQSHPENINTEVDELQIMH